MSSPSSPVNNVRTPWNPSKNATKRVLNPLPVPTQCPYCGANVLCVSNAQVYGKEFGDWPWVYRCERNECNSYVGLHPFTNIPLGTLADAKTRAARIRAKQAFNPLWQEGAFTRREAYYWLAQMLGIPPAECHIGWMQVDMCYRVVRVIKERT